MPQLLKANLEEVLSGASASIRSRWTATSFFDKVLINHETLSPHFWSGSGVAKPIPGLPRDEFWQGIEVVNGHIMLWNGNRLKWSDANDFTGWIPVSLTASTARGRLVFDFIQPEATVPSEWVYFDNTLVNFAEGQFVRIFVNEDDPAIAAYNFYSVTDVANVSGLSTRTLSVVDSIIPTGGSGRIYLETSIDWVKDLRVKVSDTPQPLTVDETVYIKSGSWLIAQDTPKVPGIGATFDVTFEGGTSNLTVGDIVSLSESVDVGRDLYEVVSVGSDVRLKRLGIGTTPAAAGLIYPKGAYGTFQPSIKVTNFGSGDAFVSKGSQVSGLSAIKLAPLYLTGQSPAGTIIPAGNEVISVTANEAGELFNVGSQINGEIFAVTNIGEYGYILKERSIQSLNYVGRASGVFFPRAEVVDEGPISKYAWCRVFRDNQVSGIAFLGHKELYLYTGGQDLQDVAKQYTNELFDELDLSRRDEVVMFHKEQQNEIWLIYPVKGSTVSKVFIFNYLQNTVAIDQYDDSLGGITAAGTVQWETAETWESLDPVRLWPGETERWYELYDQGAKTVTLLAVAADEANPALGELPGSQVPRLLQHGETYSRATRDDCDPKAYRCEVETPDFDFGSAEAWKYVHSVYIGLQIKADAPVRPAKLYVQIGARDNPDSELRWSAPTWVDVSGNANKVTQANIRMAGRIIRVRFYSEEAGAQWRISSYKILGRMGGKV